MSSADTPRRWRAFGVAIVVVVAYVAVLIGYALGDSSEDSDSRTPDSGAVLVYVDVDAVNAQDFSIGARLSVYPGRDLLDGKGFPEEDLVVDFSPMASDTAVTFSSGRGTGPIATTIYSDGDVRTWPFDDYRAESVVVQVLRDTEVGAVEVPSTIVVTDSLSGWNVDAGDADHPGGTAFDVTVERNTPTMIFSIALCIVLLTLPACALFVALQTLRGRKKFQPPMVTWFAVMLFAVLPIRNLFPGAPPIGSWVDFSVVLWVVLGLVTAMVVYVRTWWREAP